MLAEIRIRKDLTQTELAELSGVSQSMISSIERGDRQPTIKLGRKLALVLGCRIDELLDEPSAAGPPMTAQGLDYYRSGR